MSSEAGGRHLIVSSPCSYPITQLPLKPPRTRHCWEPLAATVCTPASAALTVVFLDSQCWRFVRRGAL
jgi:hypothetical protein